jgi:hypothetical protein
MANRQLLAHPAVRTVQWTGCRVLGLLRVLSGLVVLLAAIVVMTQSPFSGEQAGTTARGSHLAPNPSPVVGFPASPLPTLVFYLVASQDQANEIAAREYEVWEALRASSQHANDRSVHVLFAGNPAEEDAANADILQTIRASRIAPNVVIEDARTSPGK